MLLKDRVALVTGASRGIGAAIAGRLAEQGAAVGVNYFKSEAAAQEVVQRIEKAGGRALAVQADTRNAEQVTAMTEKVGRDLGPIDILVINASINFPIIPFLNFEWADFEAKVLGETASAYHACRAVVPGMVERKRGSIIAISSTLSRQSAPGYSAHSMAKAGLDGFVRSLAIELAPHGVRVNAVAPGLIDTDATAHIPAEVKAALVQLVPFGRIGMPDDIAGVVTFLASDAAGYMTGAYLPSCGGAMMV